MHPHGVPPNRKRKRPSRLLGAAKWGLGGVVGKVSTHRSPGYQSSAPVEQHAEPEGHGHDAHGQGAPDPYRHLEPPVVNPHEAERLAQMIRMINTQGRHTRVSAAEVERLVQFGQQYSHVRELVDEHNRLVYELKHGKIDIGLDPGFTTVHSKSSRRGLGLHLRGQRTSYNKASKPSKSYRVKLPLTGILRIVPGPTRWVADLLNETATIVANTATYPARKARASYGRAITGRLEQVTHEMENEAGKLQQMFSKLGSQKQAEDLLTRYEQDLMDLVVNPTKNQSKISPLKPYGGFVEEKKKAA